MPDKGPEQIMDAYRAELRRLYGEERAEKTILYYGKGWYYVNLARRFHDGSVGALGNPTCYRRKQMVEMTDNLRKRKEAR